MDQDLSAKALGDEVGPLIDVKIKERSRDITIRPTTPARKPMLYGLKPWWNLKKWSLNRGRTKPTIGPMTRAAGRARAGGQPKPKARWLTRGLREVLKKPGEEA